MAQKVGKGRFTHLFLPPPYMYMRESRNYTFLISKFALFFSELCAKNPELLLKCLMFHFIKLVNLIWFYF